MTAKITPGPWQIAGEYNREGRLSVIANVDGDLPDGPFTFDFICSAIDEYDVATARAEANMRAIAALPAMVEALSAVRNFDWRNNRTHLLEMVDAALKLAGIEP